MAKDNKIQMPSGQGGLTRYFDEYVSKIELSPWTVVVICIVIAVLVALLDKTGQGLLP